MIKLVDEQTKLFYPQFREEIDTIAKQFLNVDNIKILNLKIVVFGDTVAVDFYFKQSEIEGDFNFYLDRNTKQII